MKILNIPRVFHLCIINFSFHSCVCGMNMVVCMFVCVGTYAYKGEVIFSVCTYVVEV